LRFAIDSDPIGRDGSGNETYLTGLLRGMDTLAEPGEELILFGSEPRALNELGLHSASVVACRPGLGGEIGLGRKMRRQHIDVVLAHYNLPIAVRKPVATIVHDVAFLRVPDTFARRQAARLRLSVHRSVMNSEATVTVSEFSKRELLDCFPRLDDKRIVVAPNAADPGYFERLSSDNLEATRKRYELPRQFVLAVGNIQPRKNLARTAEAAGRCGIPLVVVGRQHGLALDGPVKAAKWLGYVPGTDLVALYQLCTVFCYVSLYEGFGLPVVEALASGAVVVTSDNSGTAEVAGDAAVLADPVSVDSVIDAMGRALGDSQLRERLQCEGPNRARRYSWIRSASIVFERLRRLAE
jgi:glycosyltransferase involved in cell wall biosynthesis